MSAVIIDQFGTVTINNNPPGSLSHFSPDGGGLLHIWLRQLYQHPFILTSQAHMKSPTYCLKRLEEIIHVAKHLPPTGTYLLSLNE